MGDNFNITSRNLWNARWQSSRTMVIKEDDTYWGRNGIFMRVMRRQLGEISGNRVVEFGGANSTFLLALAKWADAFVTAVDYSEPGIEKLEELFEINACSVNAVCADMFLWEPGNTKYDLVVHWGLLEHFKDPLPVLEVCKNSLASDGNLVFTMPNMKAWGAALWRRWSPKNYAMHIYHSDKSIDVACEAAGLIVTKRFFWGRPMLQRTRWEHDGLLPRAVTFFQRSFNLANRFVPYYQYGSHSFSMERGFVVKRLK